MKFAIINIIINISLISKGLCKFLEIVKYLAI